MKFLFLITLCALATIAIAQKKISVADFTTEKTFTQKEVKSINWMKDGKYYTTLTGNKIVRYDVTTGQEVETVVDGNLLTPALEIEDYTLSPDEKVLLLRTDFQNIYRRSFTAKYFVYDRQSRSVRALSANGKQSNATFSPDGSKVGFVRKNDLFYVNIQDMTETRVTDDGKFNFIINGSTDWVYEEEFTFVTAFFWSPDSRKLAYYKFDESEVREYNLQKWNEGQLYPEDYRFKYPKAGEKNSTVQIWIYDVISKNKLRSDLGSETDVYIPRVKWTADPNILSVRKLNRLQNQLDVIHVDASSGKSSVVLTEKSDAYVDIEFIDDLIYLDDKKHFIHSSERSGFKHLYLFSMDGKLVKPITSGNFEVSEFLGIDQKSKVLYYLSTEVSPMEKHLFSMTLDGKKKTRLSQAAGNHVINLSGDYQFYIDHHSSANTPAVATLYRTNGNRVVKVLEKNEELAATVAEFDLPAKEFFTFKTVDGSELNGYMLKPKNFDAAKQYPLVIYQYSGPGSQNVTNAFAGSHVYFHYMLAQHGYIVAVIDPRGTAARGEKFRKQTYRQLGKFELEDIIAGGKYLGSLDYVDETRLAVWGWSYGGYVSSLAMTKGGGLFKVGIAVAPVTNWRFYDTVYTERFLQTPQLNPGGYDDNSPLTYAADLQGKFLLVHGTGDDNVHFQNSVVFQDALIAAGKQFQSFYYPDKAHSISGGKTRLHLYTQMADFIAANL